MDKVFNADKASRLLCEDRMNRQPPERIIERLSPAQGETWLDLGSGNGFMTIPLLENGASVVALDLQDEMLRMLRERVPEGLAGGLTTVRAKLPMIPLPDDSVDHAVMINVFHEVSDPTLLTSELGRVIRGHGTLHIIDHRKMRTEHGPPLEHRLSPEEVSDALGITAERTYIDEFYYHLVFRL